MIGALKLVGVPDYLRYNSHLGQPLQLFDKSGKVTWQGELQAFGEIHVAVNKVTNHLRSAGQYEDGETGLYYNFHRYYDSELGRYLKLDPAGFRGGLNPYSYVGASPLEYIDPLGLWAIGDPLPQDFVDASVGFGDGILEGLTLGLWDGQKAREKLGIDGHVNYCSDLYQNFNIAGTVVGALTTGLGAEMLAAKALGGLRNAYLAARSARVSKSGHSAGAMARREYQGASYHGKVGNAVKSKAPTNGQDALDMSVQVKGTSPRRVGIDYQTGEFAVFDQTSSGVFHGHVRGWKDLTSQMQNALRKAGMVDRKGNILGGGQ